MSKWMVVAALMLPVFVGCGGGDDGGSSATPGLSIRSGNNQTVTQHLRGRFEIRVADAANKPLAGTDVTFSAPGLTLDPSHSTATSDDAGIATFLGSFHTLGNIQITASAAGYPPITLFITVTQNPYRFDGYYDCLGRGTNGGLDKYYLRVEGAVVSTDNDLAGLRNVIYDTAGGSLFASQRQGLDVVGHWEAMFAVDAQGVATLTGTDQPWWRDSYPLPNPPSPLACTRQ